MCKFHSKTTFQKCKKHLNLQKDRSSNTWLNEEIQVAKILHCIKTNTTQSLFTKKGISFYRFNALQRVELQKGVLTLSLKRKRQKGQIKIR